MAKRPVFRVNNEGDKFVEEIFTEFKWYPGYSLVQKQKSINSLHDNYKKSYKNDNILEISSKSEDELGRLLSAFNLTIDTKYNGIITVECAFQGSKVFENGGPFTDIYNKSSLDAKKDERLKKSGKLLYFQYLNEKWPLEPKTIFYDWIYINGLYNKSKYIDKLTNYQAFTDIEYNPEKSINCQARSVALYVSLLKRNLLDKVIINKNEFINIIESNNKECTQINFLGNI